MRFADGIDALAEEQELEALLKVSTKAARGNEGDQY